MKEISIIVPCYNVEKYIDQCVQSLVNQIFSLEKMELIFVDDASTDTTLEHLKVWEQEYSDSILLIACDQNGRQGTARNIGMQYAQGKYIGFVDADDWVEPEMFESMLQKAEEYDCDMVSCHAYRNREDGQQIPEITQEKDWFLCGQSTLEGGNWPSEFIGSVWSRIYRRKILVDNQIYFPEQLCYEDNYFATIAAMYCRSIYHLERCLYHYRENDTSTTLARNNVWLFDRLEIELLKLEEFRKLQLLERFPEEIEKNFFELYYFNTMYMMATRFDIPSYEIFQRMEQQIRTQFPNYKSNKSVMESGNPVWDLLLKVLDCHFTKEQFENFMKKYAALPRN